jgi:hypothetical protein
VNRSHPDRPQDIGKRLAQAMHLIQKVQDYANAIMIDTELLGEVSDEFGAR